MKLQLVPHILAVSMVVGWKNSLTSRIVSSLHLTLLGALGIGCLKLQRGLVATRVRLIHLRMWRDAAWFRSRSGVPGCWRWSPPKVFTDENASNVRPVYFLWDELRLETWNLFVVEASSSASLWWVYLDDLVDDSKLSDLQQLKIELKHMTLHNW